MQHSITPSIQYFNVRYVGTKAVETNEADGPFSAAYQRNYL
jgi:hypothetical protein